jgi:hypothetical protein
MTEAGTVQKEREGLGTGRPGEQWSRFKSFASLCRMDLTELSTRLTVDRAEPIVCYPRRLRMRIYRRYIADVIISPSARVT